MDEKVDGAAMNAKELRDALQGDTCPWWVISDKELQDTILRADFPEGTK